MSERDAHLLSIGHQCSESTCNLVDFLPFKCQHCEQSFCGEHFKVGAHRCTKYDESKYNRVAPSCPLCNTPVAIPPGQDPNIRMERHFNTECSVMTGKTKAKSPTCARAKCGKVLFAPIQCDKCKLQFCPQHRFPTDHSCSSRDAAPKPVSSKPSANIPTKASTAAAMAAIQRSLASASKTSRAVGPTKTNNVPNPFSKVDRALHVPTNPPSNTKPNEPAKSTPERVIDPMAFIPRPIFASA